MHSTFAVLAFAAAAAALPGGVSSNVAPSSSPAAGCLSTYDGTFQIQVVNKKKRSLAERNSPLLITLTNGVLKDSEGRTGYVASNQQFQFDKPPQAGAIYTAGFSICPGNYLAIGADTTWYKCLSGTFYNLYDSNDAGQCSPVYIKAVGGAPVASTSVAESTPAPASSSSSSAAAGYSSSSSSYAAPVTSASESASVTYAPVTQLSDGQPQGPTSAAAACSEYVDGQPQCASSVPAPPVCSEYVDGQPQCGASTGYLPSYASGTGAPVPSYTGPAIASGPAAMATPMAGLFVGAIGIVALL